jgi:hypothetical protein
MKKDDFKTDVIFRIEKDKTILAVFPYDIADPKGNVTGYSHIGQHQAVCWDFVLFRTKPAKENEYQELFKELESISYNLRIVKRKNYTRWLAEFNKIR